MFLATTKRNFLDSYLIQLNLKLLIKSRSLDVELALGQRDGQWVLHLHVYIELLAGDWFTVDADLDVWVPDSEVVLCEVVELFVSDRCETRYIERGLRRINYNVYNYNDEKHINC